MEIKQLTKEHARLILVVGALILATCISVPIILDQINKKKKKAMSDDEKKGKTEKPTGQPTSSKPTAQPEVQEDSSLPFSAVFWQVFTFIRYGILLLLMTPYVQRKPVLYTLGYVALVAMSNFELFGVPNRTTDILVSVLLVICLIVFFVGRSIISTFQKFMMSMSVLTVLISSIVVKDQSLAGAFDIEPDLPSVTITASIVFAIMFLDSSYFLVKFGPKKILESAASMQTSEDEYGFQEKVQRRDDLARKLRTIDFASSEFYETEQELEKAEAEVEHFFEGFTESRRKRIAERALKEVAGAEEMLKAMQHKIHQRTRVEPGGEERS